MLELLIALRAGPAIQRFIVNVQRILLFMEQASHGMRRNLVGGFQLLTELSQTLAFPFARTLWVTGRLMAQQGFQRLQERRVFFSTRGRPAPGVRMYSGA